MIVIILLALLCVALVVRLISLETDIRRISRRLDEIIQTDTNAQLASSSSKDIVNLVIIINKMLAKNRRDFVAAQRVEADLKRAIINISHDLRTPLTSAKGYLQMMDGEPRYMEIVKGRLDNLSGLMDNLFAFSRALEEKPDIKKMNICNILREVLSESYVELEHKGFVVEINIPETPVYAFGDEDALKRVLQNLIKNAHVHGKEYLYVGLAESIIEITNRADGLNELEISRIFDRFYTADAARTHKRTGLGLAISKELTEKMGGKIATKIENDMLVVQLKLSQI